MEEDWWELYTDGAASTRHCGAGVMLVSPEGIRCYHALVFKFRASNNAAEYEAVIAGLPLAISLGATKLRVRTDSRLVVGQLTGTFETREESMIQYKVVADGLLGGMVAHEIHHVPQLENNEADILSKLAGGGMPSYIAQMWLVEEIELPSTEALSVCPVVVDQVPAQSWIDLLKRYMQEEPYSGR